MAIKTVAARNGDVSKAAVARLLDTFFKAFQVARVFGAMDHSMTISAQDSEIHRNVIFHRHAFYLIGEWLLLAGKRTLLVCCRSTLRVPIP